MKYFLTIYFLLSPLAVLAQNIIGSWDTASTIGFPPRYGHASSVINGIIYVMGGYDVSEKEAVQYYDPSIDEWFTPGAGQIKSGFTMRHSLCSVVVDGKIYAMGGSISAAQASNLIQVLNPSTNMWTTPVTTGTMTPRQNFSATVYNGKIYVIGGYDPATHSTINKVEVFDPLANTWDSLATTGIYIPCFGHTSSLMGNKIYVIGGWAGDLHNYPGEYDTLEVLDLSTHTWSRPKISGFFTGRGIFASSVLHGKVYVFGGNDKNGNSGILSNSVQEFDPSTNTWSTPLISGNFTNRSLLTADEVNGKIYTIGGFTSVHYGALNSNEVLTPTENKVNSEFFFDLSVYPNPSNGVINIANAPKNLSYIIITNILGETAMMQKNPPPPDFTLDLSKLVPGTYYIRFSSANSVVTKKIMKN